MREIQDDRTPFLALRGQEPEALFSGLTGPACLIDEEQLRQNAAILSDISGKTGAKLLLDQQAFPYFDFYPLLCPAFSGTSAGSLYGARMCAEKMPGREVHVSARAYEYEPFARLMRYADHIVFSSVSQLETFGPTAKGYGKSIGLRADPRLPGRKETKHSPVCQDPGITRADFNRQMQEYLLCIADGLQLAADPLPDPESMTALLKAADRSFGDILRDLQWIRLGMGFLPDSCGDLEKLLGSIRYAQKTWETQVYLEAGAAAVQNAGLLISHVLDITDQGETAVLDAVPVCSGTPMVYGATISQGHSYHLTGVSALTGSLPGTYTFSRPLSVGSILVFGDTAACHSRTPLGAPRPDLWAWKGRQELAFLAHFSYPDFLSGLGTVPD